VRKIERIIAGLQIFAKIPGPGLFVQAQHDVLYGAPPNVEISDEDKAKLEELGWHHDPNEGWRIFT
jgi:hypothetical protein